VKQQPVFEKTPASWAGSGIVVKIRRETARGDPSVKKSPNRTARRPKRQRDAGPPNENQDNAR